MTLSGKAGQIAGAEEAEKGIPAREAAGAKAHVEK
jgi:hypothetical protein